MGTKEARFAVAALLCALLVGCASAEKRYAQGVELEHGGQHRGAAARYIQALRTDPAHAESRSRLQHAGARALDALMLQADQDLRRGDPVRAAQSYLEADALLLAARGVQVTLLVGEDYAPRRRVALDGAIAALMRSGHEAEAGALWSEAIDRYAGISGFEPSAAQASAARAAHARALAAWAEAELASGHHRAAAERAREALALMADTATAAAVRMDQVRRLALDAGTVVVAFLPVRGAAARSAPGQHALLEALNDALDLEHWTRPPPFVASVDPLQVRRAMRDLRAPRGPVPPGLATRVGRALGSDLVVVCTLAPPRVSEQGVRERERPARTHAGAATSYRVASGTRVHQVEVRYQVLDAGGRGELARGRVSASESQRFERAAYPGDSKELVLGRAERRAFEAPAPLQHSGERLAGELAARLARHVLESVLDLIP